MNLVTEFCDRAFQEGKNTLHRTNLSVSCEILEGKDHVFLSSCIHSVQRSAWRSLSEGDLNASQQKWLKKRTHEWMRKTKEWRNRGRDGDRQEPGGLDVRGPTARGRCGGRAGSPDPCRRRCSAVPPPGRHAGGGAGGPRGAPETRAWEPGAGARGRGRCSCPTLDLRLRRPWGRTMSRGAEALDLPVWNSASAPSWEPRRSNAMSHLDSDVKEECLREDLKFYFMNPCEKFRARHQIPWKLCLQILKIVMVTTQLVRFGLSNQLVVAFKEENTVAFKYLFLKGYSGIDEDNYSCSVYTQEDAYESIFYAINQYHHLKNMSLGTLSYGENEENRTGLKVCKQHYKTGTMFPSNETLTIDSSIEADCLHLDLRALSKNPPGWKNSSFFRLEFYRLLQVEISFHLKGIDLQTILSRELPDCYVFQNTITFDNKAHSGKIKIYFDSNANIGECKGVNISGSVQKNTQYVLAFDAFIIVICLASLILCTRSIFLALSLRKRFLNFFLEKYKRHVCNADKWEFVNGWYILVIISDLMTVIGSILKMEIQVKNLTNYDLCSILLGTSTLLVWVGVIRYLGYFQKYNVLILTMQASLPKVLRFCACAGMIYLGYTFCGWIVLGPYHNKFVGLNTVSECLFSLVNGDDMFATFAQIQQRSVLVWLFSRLYLYSFISLFIYMVLSLFIALITDSYDTIKKYQQNGFPVTDLQAFLEECGSRGQCQKEPSALLCRICCLRRKESDDHLILPN